MKRTTKLIISGAIAISLIALVLFLGTRYDRSLNTLAPKIETQKANPTPYPAINQSCYDEAKAKAEKAINVVNPNYRNIAKERLIAQGFTEEEALEIALDATLVKAGYFEKYYQECLAK